MVVLVAAVEVVAVVALPLVQLILFLDLFSDFFQQEQL